MRTMLNPQSQPCQRVECVTDKSSGLMVCEHCIGIAALNRRNIPGILDVIYAAGMTNIR